MFVRTDASSVGLDGFNLALPKGTGVATYARTLSHALRGMGRSVDVLYGLNVPKRARPALRETLFFAALGEGRTGAEPPDKKNLLREALLAPWPRTLLEVPIRGQVVTDALAERLPAYDRLFTLPSLFHVARRYFRRYGEFMTVRVPRPPAIMHWTYPLPLRLAGARNVYTLHDLVPLRLPFTSLDDRRYYYRLVRRCVAEADHICTVSETSRCDILATLGGDPERITNTYQAVRPPADAAPEPRVLASRLRGLFGLKPGRYFLFFGAIEPKKNLGRLIEAYLAAELADPLVIAGPRAWKSEEELRLLGGAHGEKLLERGRIRLLEYVPAAQLAALVRGAKAVLFPSLYEGFGLPAVEAMALGAPVMTSTAGASPEIVGDAALLVDPYNVGGMIQALRRLDDDEGLRAALAAAGPRRAERFGMAPYQSRLEALHRRVLDAPRPVPRRSPLELSLEPG
ncbi:MAG: glycosyltransferase family 4 protein [Caulobacteraceae bacterium]|nr:glycosyltransferase family 4 protein [Caulobacteraceae bacterium]